MVVRTMHGAGASAAQHPVHITVFGSIPGIKKLFLLHHMMLKVYYWRQLKMIMLLFFLRTNPMVKGRPEE